MDTSILHTRIKDYKAKATHPTSKEMITLFETWLVPIEQYISDVELSNFQLDLEVAKLKEMISMLYDIIIITGNADKLTTIEDKYTQEAISLLLKNKDRINHNSLSAISTLLYINSDQKFESIEQLKEYASRV